MSVRDAAGRRDCRRSGTAGRAGAALACVGLLVATRALGGAAIGSAPRPADAPPRSIDAECPVCKGDGTLGEIGCAKCAADGHVGSEPCKTCTGSGRVIHSCSHCEGKGELTFRGKTLECPRCKGSGSPPCLACAGKGTIRRPNPEAASWPTTDCTHCSATGFEQKEKCRRCAGKGTLSFTESVGRATPGNRNVRTVTFDCVFCGGDGEGPPLCRKCYGKGFVGPDRAPRPCGACFATGHAFQRCRMCVGRGWVRAPKEK